MGKRGPAPRPTTLKLLHGERHKDRINPDEPKPRPVLPILPDDASDDVREVWDETLAELDAMDLAHAADAAALRCFCEAVVVHRKASAELTEKPILIITAQGSLARNPALAVQRDAAQTIRAFAQEFGLTPSARSSIRAGEAGGGGEENPFASTGT